MRGIGAFFFVAACGACGMFLAPDEPAPPPVTPSDANDDPASTIDAAGEASVTEDAGCEASCPPVLLATLSGIISRIVYDGEFLFVTRGPKHGGAGVYKIKSSLPSPAIVVEETAVSGNVATHASGVYWGASDGVHRLTREPDASATVFKTETKRVSGVAVQGNTLHYATNEFDNTSPPGRFYSCDLPSCSSASFGLTVNHATDLVITSANRAYIAWPSNEPLTQVPYVFQGLDDRVDSGAVTSGGWMSVDGPNAYLPTAEGLWRIATSATPGGASVETLIPTTPPTPQVRCVAVLGSNLIVFGQGKQLRTCTVSGSTCNAVTIATANDDLTAVAVGPADVYYGTDKGAVFRIPRP